MSGPQQPAQHEPRAYQLSTAECVPPTVAATPPAAAGRFQSNDGVHGIRGGDARGTGERGDDPDPEVVLSDRKMAGRSNVAGEDGPKPLVHGAPPAAVAAIPTKLNNSTAAGV
jgi:hypothetical protein